MIRYIIFKKRYKSDYAKYEFIPNVKYVLKGEDFRYYFTIKNVRLPKKFQSNLYEVYSTR